MTGQVTSRRQAQVAVLVRGPQGAEQLVTAVIDTGFTGHLTLPRTIITSLGLPFDSPVTGRLADGSRVLMRVYLASVAWDGADRPVLVLEADSGPLLGMAMLQGSRVCLDVVDGGPVQIDPLTSP